jgi:AraC-like DNA-binding protein
MQLAEVKKWIDANLKTIHSIDDVADAFSVAPETFRKDFLRVEGESPWQFIRVRKVERIKHLLVDTDWKCVSIAHEVGMREESATRLFREITGKTMDEFRRLHGDGKAAGRGGEGKCRDEAYPNSQPFQSTRMVNGILLIVSHA